MTLNANVTETMSYDSRLQQTWNDRRPGSSRDPNEVSRSKRDGIASNDNVLGKFPTDLGIHFMSFNFRKARHGRSFGAIQKTFTGTAFLPIPGNLVDSFNINYNDVELGVAGGAIANMVQGAPDFVEKTMNDVKGLADMSIANIAAKVIEVGTEQAKELATNLRDASGEQLSVLAREGTGGFATGLNRMFNGIPNPNVTALFRGVGLKSHSFEWKLAPRNKQETTELFAIVHAFKHTALPDVDRQTTRMTMGFPDECVIKIHGTNPAQYLGDVETMIMFKPCVIKNVTVNYTPDNTPSFFREDGYPTAVSLRLDLQETMIHTKGDYPRSAIGG